MWTVHPIRSWESNKTLPNWVLPIVASKKGNSNNKEKNPPRALSVWPYGIWSWTERRFSAPWKRTLESRWTGQSGCCRKKEALQRGSDQSVFFAAAVLFTCDDTSIDWWIFDPIRVALDTSSANQKSSNTIWSNVWTSAVSGNWPIIFLFF